MKEMRHIKAITTFALISVFALQTIWLINIYALMKEELYKSCNSILNEALYEEANLRTMNLPTGVEIMGGPAYDSIPENTYLYDSLLKMGLGFSVTEIDSLASILFNAAGIDADFMICTVNPRTKEMYESSKKLNVSSFNTIQSPIIPLRLDYSQGIQMILYNPYTIIFERIALLLVATFIMMVIVLGCVYSQIRIIIQQRKEARQREDFSYAMIHDMKTPLTTILMTLNLLHTGRIAEKVELKGKYIAISLGEITRLLRLTNKVLTLSKLEGKKISMKPTTIQLPLMLKKVAERFNTTTVKPFKLTTDLQSETIMADAEYMEEVFNNLTDNAIKYSKENCDVEITITSSEDSNRYTITFADNGLGISKKAQEHIFEKFERGDAIYRSNSAAGFGLGLNFVYQVISAHNGSIMIDSEKGEYTKFIIYIPKLIENSEL